MNLVLFPWVTCIVLLFVDISFKINSALKRIYIAAIQVKIHTGAYRVFIINARPGRPGGLGVIAGIIKRFYGVVIFIIINPPLYEKIITYLEFAGKRGHPSLPLRKSPKSRVVAGGVRWNAFLIVYIVEKRCYVKLFVFFQTYL